MLSARWTVFVGLLILVASGTVIAEANPIYKWTDERGVTHYSESPPPVGKAEKLPPVAPSESATVPSQSKSWAEKEQEFQQRRIEREEAEEQHETARKIEEKRRLQLCLIARHDLEVFQRDLPVYWVNERGEREYLEDSKRLAAIESATKRISAYCKGF